MNLDRGFLYGDGVFESLRTYNGKPFLLDEHLKRLYKALKIIRIKPPLSAKQLKAKVLKELKAKKLKETYIKIIITRGEAKEPGLDPKKAGKKPTLIILIEKLKKKKLKPWKAIISSIIKPENPSSTIKSLCYLDNILAKMQAKKFSADEAFLLDQNGYLAEGTISNIFIVKLGTVYTPSLASPILAGVTRKLVIKLAKQSAFRVVEKDLNPKDLYNADECFVTFSGSGIVPIVRIWNKRIGKGKPGYVTEALIKRYDAETKKSIN